MEDDTKANLAVRTYLNDSGFSAKDCLPDIMMQEVDGFRFAETVRQVNKTISVLFISAKDDLPSKQKGVLLGFDDCMVKPIELDKLLLRIGAVLWRTNLAEKTISNSSG